MTNVLQQQFLYCFTWSSSQLLNLNIRRLFYLSTRFLSALAIESSAIHWLPGLTYLFLSFWLFLVGFFWMLWMLVTVHVRHASQITTWGTIFTVRLFSVFKEWIRSWSHALLITYDKTFTKNLLLVRPEEVTRRKKKKKN